MLDPSLEQFSRRDFMAHAEAAAGLSDWGDERVLQALDRICQAVHTAKPAGASLAKLAERVVAAGARRLQLVADRRRYPEIALQQISRPLILMGLPRSGTTILHALLAQDPEARSPLLWEVNHPSPPPRKETFRTDPRIGLTEAEVGAMDAEFRAMHAIGAQLPEECNAILTVSFQSVSFWAAAGLDDYVHWLLNEADMDFAYDIHRQVLQHLQAFSARAWWTLKSPPHLLFINSLMRTYPDARVVMTHRDPATCIASNASLIVNRRGGAAHVDLRAVGREQVSIWGEGLRRTAAYRRANGHDDQFFDSHYSDFMSDPMGTIRAIYGHFGMTLTKEAQRAMEQFLAANRQGKHGEHRYTPEQFGLNPAAIRCDLADYIDTYRVKV